jgi:Cd2+/Zn2+-exporting ATPase
MEVDEEEEIFEGEWYAHPLMRNALIAAVLTGVALVLGRLGLIPGPVQIAFYSVAIVLGGYHWAREGVETLVRKREIGIDVLMLAAAIGSAVLGMWAEAAFLAFLYGAAEGLEEYTYARTRASIRGLLDLAPKEARVMRDGAEVTIPAGELRVGDIFVVRPGESIATDGVIIDGRSSVNEAPVTGESIPAEKREGMSVFAGTLNQEGALRIEATATFEDNTLSKMIYLVEEAQQQKGRAELFIERFGRRYSPLVLLSGLLMVVIPALLGAPLAGWATRAVVLWVAAAPCALVMSTPVASAAGIARAGRSGVLIKGGVSLEGLGRVKVVAMDKTGTLTKGEPVVTDILPFGADASAVLNLAYSVERYSEHPLAKAIVRKAQEAGAGGLQAEDFSALAGYGAKATVADRMVYVGKQGLFQKLGQDDRSIPQIAALRGEGKTVMLVGTEANVEGVIAIRDEVRPEARGMVEELQRMGVKVIMLTGDNEVTARAIARELGVDEVRADLKPEDKVTAIKALEEEYGAVAMVGDGINDAPALAQATVGIAMGVAGTDAAIEAADVALMADDLSKVAFAITLGKRARKISLQNIVFSLLILAVLIPLAVLAVMGVATAVLAHETSELVAVANGLRVARP